MDHPSLRGKRILAVCLGAAVAFAVFVMFKYSVTLASSIVIYSIYVSGANMLTGYTGLVSLGQAMFWGSAAYVAAILTTRGIVTNFYLIMLLGLVLVAALSSFFGVLAL